MAVAQALGTAQAELGHHSPKQPSHQAEVLALPGKLFGEAVQPLEHVSFSAGIAELAEGDTAEAVLRRADALLYKSKREGRARTSASD